MVLNSVSRDLFGIIGVVSKEWSFENKFNQKILHVQGHKVDYIQGFALNLDYA